MGYQSTNYIMATVRTIMSALTEEKAVIRPLDSNLSTSSRVIFTLIWWVRRGLTLETEEKGGKRQCCLSQTS